MDPITASLIRARRGDERALESFIRATQADVWRLCHRLGPPGQADDLTQTTYLRMMHTVHRFRGDASGRTWILAIARHVALDALRAAVRRRRREALDERTEPIAEPNHVHDVAQLFEYLDGAQREAIVLTQLLGMSYEEAAEICECPVGTIRSRVARARSHLITLLADATSASETA